MIRKIFRQVFASTCLQITHPHDRGEVSLFPINVKPNWIL